MLALVRVFAPRFRTPSKEKEALAFVTETLEEMAIPGQAAEWKAAQTLIVIEEILSEG